MFRNPVYARRFWGYYFARRAKNRARRARSTKGITFMIVIGTYGGFQASYEKKFAIRICLGWIAFTIYLVDIENYLSDIIEREKYAKKITDQVEASLNKQTLSNLQQDPDYELMQEFGKLLMRDVSSLTSKEKKRYDELRNLLNPKKVN
jgi:hypothetical protein